MGGQKFTRVSDNGRKYSKLDRFLVSSGFCLVWKNLGVKALERKWSDHYPIMLSDVDLNFGPKPFKGFDTWLEGDNIESVVREAWGKEVVARNPDRVFKEKLKNVKIALKTFCNEKFRSLDGELERNKVMATSLEAIADLRSLNEEERGRWLEARKKWMDAEKKKTEMARQKSFGL